MAPSRGLRRFVEPPVPQLDFARSPKQAMGETCEMCGVDIPDEHPHVVNVDTRSMRCACRPCYLLFTQRGAGGGNLLAVPERYLSQPDASLSEGLWDSLQVPVAMAFFFNNTALGHVVAQYPSPAGATESLLDLSAWDEVVATNPLAAALEPDVEALLVNRTREGNEVFLVPIDVCYELVGRVRMKWSGFDGGAEAREEIDAFLDRVRSRSRPLRTAVS